MGNDRKLVSFARADECVPTPTNWLIDGWLVKDSLASLVGASGSGKSFLAIDWAMRVATGTPWHGRNVKQGAVFVLAGEGRNGIRTRIAGIERAFGIPVAGAPLFLADCLPALTHELNAAAVLDEVRAGAERAFVESGCEPALVIIDTVARAMAGANENTSEDMGRLIQAMDGLRSELGACVLSLHHTGHGSDTQDRARGSSAYRAALDSEFVTKANESSVTVRSTKCKDWTSPIPLTLNKLIVEVELAVGGGTGKASTLVLCDPIGAVVEGKQKGDVFALHMSGRTLRQIADETGVARSTVHRWLSDMKAEHDHELEE